MVVSPIRLSVLIVGLTVVVLAQSKEDADPLARLQQLRGQLEGVLQGFTDNIQNGARQLFRWASQIGQPVSLEKQAERLLIENEKARNRGQELVNKGRRLLQIADDLDAQLARHVGKRSEVIAIVLTGAQAAQASVKTLREAAELSITTGNAIIDRSDKLADAIESAGTNISAVVREGFFQVGSAMKNIGESINKALLAIQQAKTSAENLTLGFGNALFELHNAGVMVVKAVRSFEDVGRHALSLVQEVIRLGQNLFDVVRDAAQRIGDAVAFQGRK